jgi:hypothetical protein
MRIFSHPVSTQPAVSHRPSLAPRTAFVLAGGGSLGAMQVGMLRALYERGIAPDLLVGTSAGALNAAFIATRSSRRARRDRSRRRGRSQSRAKQSNNQAPRHSLIQPTSSACVCSIASVRLCSFSVGVPSHRVRNDCFRGPPTEFAAIALATDRWSLAAGGSCECSADRVHSLGVQPRDRFGEERLGHGSEVVEADGARDRHPVVRS